MRCKICNINVATQTGSHLVSNFFVKGQVGDRNNPRLYLLDAQNPYRDYTEKLDHSVIIEDYLFCPICEKKLSRLETYIAQEYSEKINSESRESRFTIDYIGNWKTIRIDSVNPVAVALLFQSFIFRAHLAPNGVYSHFYLSEELAERIRLNLDLFLPDYDPVNHKFIVRQRIWLKDIINNVEIFEFVPMILLKAPPELENSAHFSIVDQINPSFGYLGLNDHFMIFAMDEGLLNRYGETFSCCEIIISNSVEYIFKLENPIILELGTAEVERIRKWIFNLYCETVTKVIRSNFIESYYRRHLRMPTDPQVRDEINLVMSKWLNNIVLE